MADRFEQLKQKYQPVLRAMEQQQVQLQNVNLQDNKLFIRGAAPSQDVKNKIWDQIKLVDPQYSDLICDITVSESRVQAAAAGSSQPQAGQAYTVQPGDSLSRIAEQFYGDASQYMKIFNANRDKLKDPNTIRVGQELVIPPQD